MEWIDIYDGEGYFRIAALHWARLLAFRLWSPKCAVGPRSCSGYLSGSVAWQCPSRKEEKTSSRHEAPTVLLRFLTIKLSSSSAAKSLYCLCIESRLEKCQTASRYGSHIILEDFFLFKIFRQNIPSARTRLATGNRTCHEKLIVAWLAQKFLVFYWAQNSTFAFTRALLDCTQKIIKLPRPAVLI
jgi:hypothetical protein